MALQSPKTVFSETDDYVVEYGTQGTIAFLHVKVSDWSLRVFKELKQVYKDLLNHLYWEGFEYAVTITPNPKFVRMFGGTYHGKHIEDGKEYEIFKWELKQPY